MLPDQNYFWQTDTIRLRPATQEDWLPFYENYFDTPARVLLDYEVQLPLTREGAQEVWREFLATSPERGRLNFTVETLSGEPVGGVNLNSVDSRNGTFSIGMQIGHQHRGRGYGTAAMRLLLRYAFGERRLHKFNVSVMEGNRASAAMLKKVGCVAEGTRREVIYHQGRYWDELLYGLTADDFDWGDDG